MVLNLLITTHIRLIGYRHGSEVVLRHFRATACFENKIESQRHRKASKELKMPD
jgi:hypothetical protein